MIELKDVFGIITQRAVKSWEDDWNWSDGVVDDDAGSKMELVGEVGDY